MTFRTELTEALDEKKFLDKIVDMADEINIDYMKKSTKDIIGDLVTAMRKEKKYKAMYTYWSKNRSKELLSKIEKLFD